MTVEIFYTHLYGKKDQQNTSLNVLQIMNHQKKYQLIVIKVLKEGGEQSLKADLYLYKSQTLSIL